MLREFLVRLRLHGFSLPSLLVSNLVTILAAAILLLVMIAFVADTSGCSLLLLILLVRSITGTWCEAFTLSCIFMLIHSHIIWCLNTVGIIIMANGRFWLAWILLLLVQILLMTLIHLVAVLVMPLFMSLLLSLHINFLILLHYLALNIIISLPIFLLLYSHILDLLLISKCFIKHSFYLLLFLSPVILQNCLIDHSILFLASFFCIGIDFVDFSYLLLYVLKEFLLNLSLLNLLLNRILYKLLEENMRVIDLIVEDASVFDRLSLIVNILVMSLDFFKRRCFPVLSQPINISRQGSLQIIPFTLVLAELSIFLVLHLEAEWLKLVLGLAWLQDIVVSINHLSLCSSQIPNLTCISTIYYSIFANFILTQHEIKASFLLILSLNHEHLKLWYLIYVTVLIRDSDEMVRLDWCAVIHFLVFTCCSRLLHLFIIVLTCILSASPIAVICDTMPLIFSIWLRILISMEIPASHALGDHLSVISKAYLHFCDVHALKQFLASIFIEFYRDPIWLTASSLTRFYCVLWVHNWYRDHCFIPLFHIVFFNLESTTEHSALECCTLCQAFLRVHGPLKFLFRKCIFDYLLEYRRATTISQQLNWMNSIVWESLSITQQLHVFDNLC